MKLVNNSKNALSHDNYILKVGEMLEVPQNVADCWIKIEGVKEFIAPQDIEAIKAQAVKEALEAEKVKAKPNKIQAKKSTSKK